jgi:putative IMPACT (imprinted ancient) family translation regulator
LTVLRGSGLGDAVLVVTRYLGGTLLGTGGLVKAYTEAAQSVVNAVERGQRVPIHVVMAAIPYNLLERVRILTSKNHGKILGEDYAGDITLTLQFPVENFENFQTDLRELSAGKIHAEVIEMKEEIVAVG